ncbi:hypothetical protein [Priestia flexa]|uniref:hypothetical protein n=1 Tax=Priestia flexa TaxID=86664 RepID=UPI00047330CF|nr:hypothetical protein [Priestia flexa]
MNNELDQLFESPEEWLNALPKYQRNLVSRLIENNHGDLDEATALYLNLNTSHTAPFGAGSKKSIFVDKVKKEFHNFICGHEKYSEERQKFIGEIKPLHTTVVSGVSAAIAASIGASAVYLAPIIVMLFMSMTSIGKNVWCELYSDDNEAEM